MWPLNPIPVYSLLLNFSPASNFHNKKRYFMLVAQPWNEYSVLFTPLILLILIINVFIKRRCEVPILRNESFSKKKIKYYSWPGTKCFSNCFTDYTPNLNYMTSAFTYNLFRSWVGACHRMYILFPSFLFSWAIPIFSLDIFACSSSLLLKLTTTTKFHKKITIQPLFSLHHQYSRHYAYYTFMWWMLFLHQEKQEILSKLPNHFHVQKNTTFHF